MGELTSMECVQHLLKTIQYRMGPVLVDAPLGFGSYSAGHDSRTPEEILSHVSDVLGFAVIRFDSTFVSGKVSGWEFQVERFRDTLAAVSRVLGESSLLDDTALRLIQGPLADVLTHVGQLAMLRRFARAPIAGENFFIAELPEIIEGTA
jgi:hypothetical protein